MGEKKIRSALISVFYKDGLEEIVRKLNDLQVKLYSTGGTETFIKQLGIPVTAVEDLTGYPSIFGGRVKTLHPKIFGGILYRRGDETDLKEQEQFEIPALDLVIVDLYPFEETLSKTSDEDEIIEKIDIGGISLIRAAAKNFNDVLICASRNDYASLLNLLNENKGSSSLSDRKLFAAKAFNITSHYDTAIFNYFNREANIPAFKQSILESRVLRYGENPHQQGIFYGNFNDAFEQLHGKEISYNNLVDLDAAVEFIDEFTQPACAVIKHTNPCGVAEANDIAEAWQKALAGDPVSAFGGIITFNRTVDKAAAEKINEVFFELIVAPDYSADALAILKQKKNRIILQRNSKSKIPNSKSFKGILNGVIEQNKDEQLSSPSAWKVVTTTSPSSSQAEDLLFAEKCVKHLKSNTIVLVRDKQLIGMGCGQTSRVDAMKQAVAKAQSFSFETKDSVLASDAFFPFNDCVQLAQEAGIAAILQPGGSVRDNDSIELCNQYKIAMVFTGLRHFKH